jgi:hypothetical protein
VTLIAKEAQPLKFRQTAEGLVCTLPARAAPAEQPYALRIEGNMPLGL